VKLITNSELCVSTSNENLVNRLETYRFKGVNRICGLCIDIGKL